MRCVVSHVSSAFTIGMLRDVCKKKSRSRQKIDSCMLFMPDAELWQGLKSIKRLRKSSQKEVTITCAC